METWTIPTDLIPPSMLIEFLNGMSGLYAAPDRLRLIAEAHTLLLAMSPYRLKISIDLDGVMIVELDPPDRRD